MQTFSFRQAKPVWAEGLEQEMNVSLTLRAVLPAGIPATLYITGHSAYQIFLNGRFFAQGPARAGHGFFRVDALPLSPALTEEYNVLCILAAGYNVNSFSLTDQPPFICAEILSGDEILFATGTDAAFAGSLYPCRVRKVQRFSFQRPFTEYYRMDASYDRVFTDPAFSPAPVALAETAPKRFLTRETLRSDYEERPAKALVCTGDAAKKPQDEKRRSFTPHRNTAQKCFSPEELELDAANLLYGYTYRVRTADPAPASAAHLPENGFAVYDMGLNTSGYLRLRITPAADAVVWAVFNEKLPQPCMPDPGSNSTCCEVGWALEGGRSYDLYSFEAYTYRYIGILALQGEITVEAVSQIAEHYPAAGLKSLPLPADGALRTIYDAAVETFRQNATDIFMDCPCRERAGWLCDSFFTARTEFALTGENRIEKAFLENFLMEESFRDLPDGMLPMCYPADHPDRIFIPNWAMWFLLELAEYKERSGDTALVSAAKDKMVALAEYFRRFENEFGLLEKLESWVFVEWSAANDFTQDVNFPTNMLYAKFLETLGVLYGDEAVRLKAEALKETIRRTAFDGVYFIDNALRQDGRLVPTKNHTETAQYYAFFTGVATKETYPALYERLTTAFGPGRDPRTQSPDVPVSNAFIGNYLRLEILFRHKAYEQVKNEIRAFFLPMALSTGTLWENMDPGASCCHGFASHVAYWLQKME